MSDGNVDALVPVVSVDDTSTTVFHEGVIEGGIYYVANNYSIPHGFYYGGYEFPVGDWEDYSQQAGIDGVEFQTPAVYGDNGSIMYHTAGYSYATQPIYGPYPPGPPIPAMRADGQLYGTQPYPYPGHLYQPSVPPGGQFVSSTLPVVEVTTSGAVDPINMGGDGNNVAVGPRPGYPVAVAPSPGPYGLPVNVPSLGPHDVQVGYEGTRTGAPWPDFTKLTDAQQAHSMSQPLPVSTLSGHELRPAPSILTHIQAGQHHPHLTGATGNLGTLTRVYQPSTRMYSGLTTTDRANHGLGANGFEPRENGRGWFTFYKGKPRGRGNGAMYYGNGSLDILNEQNRGPRTVRIRNQRTAPGALRLTKGLGFSNEAVDAPSTLVNKEQYNQSDFPTDHENARFFIIKSYSEDDVHKSIKYNVWASTPNGNRKLNEAYIELQGKTGHCPIFLFFSVNASGQFCGVAEMVGPVDFNQNLDFWQQDKWSGKFPVKWHVIKDVPNSHFRHIILENNDNKPVTNSRDTQEVRFEQGLEMLNLFKSYVCKSSILDDFQFYDNRQRAMQEKRARQHAQHQQGTAYRANNEFESKHILLETDCKLEEGKPIECVHVKSGSVKEPESSSASHFQLPSGVSEEILADKPLLKAPDKRESLSACGSEGENMPKTSLESKECTKGIST